MVDLIDRQTAIESCINHYEVGNKEQNSVIDWCVDMLTGLPSAQPEPQDVTDTNVGDMISRQAAIDALDVLCGEHRYRIPGKRETYSQYNEAWQDALDRAEGAIFNLPSVDAVNVVRYKDCAKCQVDTIFNQYWCGGERVLPNGFCNYGRRKDG